MHQAKCSKFILIALALSLSACSSQKAGEQQSALPISKHTFVIGNGNEKGGAAGTSAATGATATSEGAPSATATDNSAPAIKGSGKWSASKVKCGDFHSLELRDCINMHVTVGRHLSVSLEAEDNIAKLIDTRVVGGKLIVSATDSFQCSRAPEVVVNVPALSEIMHAGSGDLVVYDLNSPNLFIDSLGAGTSYIVGKATSERINLTGSGKVDCARVPALTVAVDSSGSGDCIVAPLKQFDAKLTGKGNVLYVGETAKVRKTATGSGELKQIVL